MANTLAELLIKVVGDTSQANRALTDTTKKTEQMGRGAVKAESDVKKLFKQIQTAVTIGAVVQLGRQITQTGIAFNKGLANVDSLLAGTGVEIEALKDDVKDLGIETGTSLEDLTDGLYQVVSAFGATSESVLQLEQATIAAKAGVATVTDAINLATAVTKAYGDTSAEAQQKVFDSAFATVKLGVTSFPELASSIQQVTDRAVALGISQEELFASFATLTGVTGDAAKVSTQLRAAFVALDNPTTELAALYSRLGIESGKSLVEQEGLQGALELVVNEANKSGVSINKYLGSVEAVTAASALGGTQLENYAVRLEEIESSAGATAEAFDAQVNGINETGASLDRLIVSLEVLQTQLFDLYSEDLNNILKTFEAVTTGVGNLIDGFENLTDRAGRLGDILKLLSGATFIQEINRGIFKATALLSDGVRTLDDIVQSTDYTADNVGQIAENAGQWYDWARANRDVQQETTEVIEEQNDLVQQQADLELLRVQGVIAARNEIEQSYKEEANLIERKNALGLLSDEEYREARIGLEESYQDRLLQIGYDGLAEEGQRLQEGDRLLIASIARREELLAQAGDSEVEKVDKTAKELLEIDRQRAAAQEEIRAEEAAAEEARRQQAVQNAFAAASQIQGAFTAIAAISKAEGDAELQRLETQLEAAEEGSEERLRLEEEFDARKKQLAREDAQRQKALATFGAVISTAQAIIGFLANPGGFPGIALSALAGVTGALQIAAIQSQPLPALATGGIVPGVPSLTDNTTVSVRSGEEVIPEEDPRHTFNNNGGGTIMIKFQPEIFADIVINDFVNTGQYTIDARGLR